MNKNGSSRVTTSARQKIALVCLGLFLSLLLLEAGLRLGGSVLLSIQEYGNLRSLKKKGAYRILCLGESTTQGQYPHLLEEVLNQRNIGVRFSVIDQGRAGMNTVILLKEIESNLAEYHPDMVVAMMGINDAPKHMPFEEVTTSKGMLLIRSFRIYKLARFLWLHLLTQVKKMGYYKLDEDRLGSEKVRTYLPKTGSRKTSAEPASKAYFLKLREFYRLQDKFSQDEDLFKKAIEVDPENAPDYVELGQLYQNYGKFPQAEDSYKKAIEIDPKSALAYLKLGRLYRHHGKFPQAEDSYRKAIEINPEKYSAYVALGQLYSQQGRLVQAENFLKRALELEPKNAQICLELGWCYQYQGKYLQAEDWFKKTIELNPENSEAYFTLGCLYQVQGKLPQAENSFKRASELSPNSEPILKTIALYKKINESGLVKEPAAKTNHLSIFEHYAPMTIDNYRKLKKILDKRGIKLVCVQYPMWNIESLKKIFGKEEGAIFVDNERVFEEALKQASYKEYFVDMFAGDFGHCTQKGNELLAQNIADVILREAFNKR